MVDKKEKSKKMKDFEECVDDIHKTIGELSQSYSPNLLMSALLEISLRIILLSLGTHGLLRIYAGTVANVSMFGPLIDEMRRMGDKVDPLNFKEFQNLQLVPDEETIH